MARRSVRDESPFVLGLSGKLGSGFDTDCAGILSKRGFLLVRVTDQVDRAWEFAAVRGVLGADDKLEHAGVAAILRPYLIALVAERVQEAIASRQCSIAILAETLVADSLYCLCHAAWFVNRPDDECQRELEQRYRTRTDLAPGDVEEKLRRIAQWNRDIVVPGGYFPYDAVLEHADNGPSLEGQMARAFRGLRHRAAVVPSPKSAGQGGALLLNAAGRGGQFVRSALALSQHTRRVIRLTNVAGLGRPGCRRDVIVSCAGTCAKLFGGRATIDAERRTLDYEPGDSSPSLLEWEVPANTPLGNVMQTVLPALLCGEGRVELALRGATELNHGTPMVYYGRVLFPLLARMGARIEMDVLRHGFFGGPPGEVRITVDQVPALRPLVVVGRGAPRTLTLSMTVTASLADDCRSFPGELESFCRKQGFAGAFRQEQAVLDQGHPGFAMSAILETEHSVLGADVGCDLAHERSREGLRAALERLERRTAALLESPAALDIMCADKILGYLAVGGGRVSVPLAEDLDHLYGQIGLLNSFKANAVRVTLGENYVQLDCGNLT